MTTTLTPVSPADENIIGWFDGKEIDELAFCEEFAKKYSLKHFEGCFYNLDGTYRLDGIFVCIQKVILSRIIMDL